jgi:hypothetical protein
VQQGWQEVADITKHPAGLLRPSDDLAKDLVPSLIVSSELDALGEILESKAMLHNVSIDISNVRTVDDYIRIRAKCCEATT